MISDASFGTAARNHEPEDPEACYQELRDLVDSLVGCYTRSVDEEDEFRVLTRIATTTADIARRSPREHYRDPELVRRDVDNARFAHALRDAAGARLQHRRRTRGLLPELEDVPYTRVVLDQLAGSREQPGWLLALRLNALIDYAIALGLDTELAQALALAASRRPDGEDPEERDAAAELASTA